MLKPVMMAAAMVLTISGPVAARDRNDALLQKMLSGGPMLDEPELSRRIAQAEKYPLGSKDNPVRVAMPQGQREYLSSLRCSDGSVPSFFRTGNLGMGIYMSMIDDYLVDCGSVAPGQVHVVMDMYFPNHKESRPVPSFTMARSEDKPE